jgi:membrane-associated protease RseP (regulator of RpoE activity)
MGYAPVAGIGPKPQRRSPWIHLALFVATFLTTMLAGASFAMKNPLELTNIVFGLEYAILIMTFLTAHEFGHYIAARLHGVDVTLPYYIPMPFVTMMPFGTMGALIRMRSPMTSRRVLFDVGAAGPIAGFVVCLSYLIIGMLTTGGPESLYSIHPAYRELNGVIPATGMFFGDSLLMSGLRAVLTPIAGWIPPMNEIYHYPLLCVGWIGMFVTALNMIPFGQFDGGHVLYALLGRGQWKIARVLWMMVVVFVVFGLIGLGMDLLADPVSYEPFFWMHVHVLPVLNEIRSSMPWLFTLGSGWWLFAMIVRFVVGIRHPDIPDPTPLDPVRMVIGWGAIVIFVLCFSPQMIYFVT